jgi:hypothetical protein
MSIIYYADDDIVHIYLVAKAWGVKLQAYKYNNRIMTVIKRLIFTLYSRVHAPCSCHFHNSVSDAE